MKKSIKILLLFVLSLCLYSCQKPYFEDGRHSYFKFDNKSNLDLFIDYAGNNSNKLDIKFIADKNGRFGASITVHANTDNNKILEERPTDSWEDIISRRKVDGKKYDTLKLFIFDYAKIMSLDIGVGPFTIPCDSVLLQRYDLTIKDLDKIGWTLTYPPDERMKDIKMYPPYGQ